MNGCLGEKSTKMLTWSSKAGEVMDACTSQQTGTLPKQCKYKLYVKVWEDARISVQAVQEILITRVFEH